MELLFAPLSSLKLDAPNLEQSWKFWSQTFDLYMTASGADQKSEVTQLAIFLHLIGDEALQVYNAFTFTSNANRKQFAVVHRKLQTTVNHVENLYLSITNILPIIDIKK